MAVKFSLLPRMSQMIAVLLPLVRTWTSPTLSGGTESETCRWERAWARAAFARSARIVEAAARDPPLPVYNTSRLLRGHLAPDKTNKIKMTVVLTH